MVSTVAVAWFAHCAHSITSVKQENLVIILNYRGCTIVAITPSIVLDFEDTPKQLGYNFEW